MASTPTVRELKQELKQLGVKSPPKARKAELVALVEDVRPRPAMSLPPSLPPPPHKMRTVDLAPLLGRVREEVKRAPPDIKTAPALAEFLKKGRLESQKNFTLRVVQYCGMLVDRFQCRVIDVLLHDAYPTVTPKLWALVPAHYSDRDAGEFRDRIAPVNKEFNTRIGWAAAALSKRDAWLEELAAIADQYELLDAGAEHLRMGSARLAEMRREIVALRRGANVFVAESLSGIIVM
jgi:hypothetical protein